MHNKFNLRHYALCALAVVLCIFMPLLSALPASASSAEDMMNRSMTASVYVYESWGYDDETFLPRYPDLVGGVYIDETTGMLTILLTEEDEQLKQSILDVSQDPDCVTFVKADYSYNELQQVLDDINNNDNSLPFSMASVGIEDMENRVVAYVAYNDAESATEYLNQKYGGKAVAHSGEYEIITLDEDDSTTNELYLDFSEGNTLLVNIIIVGVCAVAALISVLMVRKNRANAPASQGKHRMA